MTWYLAAAHEPKNDLNGNLYQPCPTRTETPNDFQSAFPNLRTKYILEETWGKFKKLYVAESGFDPPTSGLWAQHASSAPLCWKLNELISDKIRRRNMIPGFTAMAPYTTALETCVTDGPHGNWYEIDSVQILDRVQNIALCEDRTHDLQIMRLTRCLLR